MSQSKKTIIGTHAFVTVSGIASPVPAKVDTGADGTAIWASDIQVDDHDVLSFVFFDKDAPLFSGVRQFYKEFEVVRVTGSTGNSEMRFRVQLPIKLGRRSLKVWCSLTDRSQRSFPMLIGKRTLRGKFLVDVAKDDMRPKSIKKKSKYAGEYKKDPKAFINKYKDEMISSEIQL